MYRPMGSSSFGRDTGYLLCMCLIIDITPAARPGEAELVYNQRHRFVHQKPKRLDSDAEQYPSSICVFENETVCVC
jgi:hypothetical protein